MNAGWVSVQALADPGGCVFAWMESLMGDGSAYQNQDQIGIDLSLCLTGMDKSANLKWSQPPIPMLPDDDFPTFCGWDELSYMFFGPDGDPAAASGSSTGRMASEAEPQTNAGLDRVAQIRAAAMSTPVSVPGGLQETNLGGETPVVFTGHVLSAEVGTASVGCGSILYAPAYIDDPAYRGAISAACDGATVNYFDARVATPSLALLSTYDCVYTWVAHNYADNVAMGDNLADYVDAGGTVVLGAFCTFTQGLYLSGRIMTAGYCPVTSPAGNNHYSWSDYAGDGTTCIHNGVAAYGCHLRDYLTLQGAGIQDGSYLDGEIAHAYRPDFKVIYSNGVGSEGCTGDWPQLVCNACCCAGAPIPGKLVADDFRCLGTMPVDSIHWWGSYFGWEEPDILPLELPIAWRIGFWSNLPPGAAQRAAYWDDPCLAIPDYNAFTSTPGVVSHTISVTDSFTVGDVDIDAIIDHTYLGDLIITVEHLGEIVTLWNRVCMGNDNMDVIFDDEGNPVACNSPTVGDVIPFEALSAFDGMDSAGDWKITVSDNQGFDTGTLLHWSVHFNNGFSQPGALLHQFVVDDWRVEMEQVGIDYYYEFYPLDICYQYYLDLAPEEVFWQDEYLDATEDDVFWLSITALYPDASDEPNYPWGWKTRPWSWMDDAVRFQLSEEPVPGIVLDPAFVEPIKDPLYEESFDVAFELDTDPNYIKWEQAFDGIRNWPHYEDEHSMATRKTLTESKWSQDPDMTLNGVDVDATQEQEPGPFYYWQPQVLADDFPCDETGPITDMHIWGSWFLDMPPFGDAGSVIFMISIYDDIPAGVVAPHSMPGEPLWERWFGPGEFGFDVAFTGEEGYYVPCEPYYEPFADSICWKYDFYIDPGEAFIQQEGNIYWLSVQALVLDTGWPIPPDTRFGWKSSWEQWNDNAVWATGEFGQPWVEWEPLFHPDWAYPLDLAFELTTTKSEVSIDRLVADDWPCEANTPITAAAWWGSYIGYGYEACQDPQTASWMDLPVKPDYFLLNIWTDVPASSVPPVSGDCCFEHGTPGCVDPICEASVCLDDPACCDPGYYWDGWCADEARIDPDCDCTTEQIIHSHPNEIIWEYKAYDYDEVLVGFDKHPYGEPNEPVFRYSVRLPRDRWFFQDEPDGVYWFSVVAVYDQHVPDYNWGLTNHEHVYNDDAVSGYLDESGAWVWSELFDQTGVSEDMSFILFTEPDCLNRTASEYADWVALGRPDCWCYPWQCRGDIDGIQTGPFHVAIPDLGLFKGCFNKFVLPPGCECADLDHIKTGPFRVAIPDLTIFKTYFNQFVVPQCDQPPIISGPYNFWISP